MRTEESHCAGIFCAKIFGIMRDVFILRKLVAAALFTCFAVAAPTQFAQGGFESKFSNKGRMLVARSYSPKTVMAVNQNIVTGTATTSTHVKRFDTPGPTETASFFAFPGFTGGVRVAVGDVNGDGVVDIITGAGPGGGPLVQVFDGVTLTLIRSFFAYSAGFTGGIFVAAGDINGDGSADIITGTDTSAGVPAEVKVFDGISLAVLRDFFPFGPSFTGGARVAAGKVNADVVADIVVGAGPGGGPQVTVFNGFTGATLHNFFAYTAGFTGGVFVASGDVNGDNRADITTGAGPGGGSEVKTFSGATGAQIGSVSAPAFTGGTHVAVGRVNADAIADIIVGPGPGNLPQVQAFDGASSLLIQNFLAYDVAFTGGVFVAAPPVSVPTPAEVSISGRVMTPDGRGLRNAYVVLTDSDGISRRVRSSSLGSYRFDNVQVGKTYVMSVSSKQYQFTTRLVTVSDELTDVDFIADCRKRGQACDSAILSLGTKNRRPK